ncbi:peptidase A1 domain-containing protein [Citrus sinensis]|uniref:Peptidase A1 domain-containing protein n=1 Tax=Citrus sinensis TaxID=2711 RepID=A0ACB8L5V7_CITSI|nr:peptidase A1 domain-containing protein [Citrus sinensis]
MTINVAIPTPSRHRRLINAAIPTPYKPKPLTIELIHRDSIRSPYHNPNESPAVRVQRGMNISIARLSYLQAKIRSQNSYEAQNFPQINKHALFYVNIFIGQPPVPMFAAMDTGSSLLWVQCSPCPGCSRIFDPSRSSSYASLPCDSEKCRYLRHAYCTPNNECMYLQGYGIGLSASGILSTEQLTFQTSDEGTMRVEDAVFGCGQSTNEEFALSGVFGLGFDRVSLVSQLNSSFSYCIGRLYDSNYLHNKLILGQGAIIDEGDATPLQVIGGLYYVTLESISVEGIMLDINPSIFRRDDSDVDRSLMRSYSESNKLCYYGIMSRDLAGFPTVRFHFAGGAELALGIDSMFHQPRADTFCMAVNPTIIDDQHMKYSLIGTRAQQNYNVGYDIGRKQMTFQMTDCEFLDD